MWQDEVWRASAAAVVASRRPSGRRVRERGAIGRRRPAAPPPLPFRRSAPRRPSLHTLARSRGLLRLGRGLSSSRPSRTGVYHDMRRLLGSASSHGWRVVVFVGCVLLSEETECVCVCVSVCRRKSRRAIFRSLLPRRPSVSSLSGFRRVPSGSFGFLRVPSGSFGFLRVPSGSPSTTPRLPRRRPHRQTTWRPAVPSGGAGGGERASPTLISRFGRSRRSGGGGVSCRWWSVATSGGGDVADTPPPPRARARARARLLPRPPSARSPRSSTG